MTRKSPDGGRHRSFFNTMTSKWARWRLKSPAPRSFTQLFYSVADQRKHQRSASLAFVRGFHRWPVNSPHKGPVTREMFPFDDVIMLFFWRHDMEMLSTLLALCEWDPLVPSGFRATEKARDTELRYYFSLPHSLRQLFNLTNSRVADDLRPMTLTWCNGLVQRLEYLHC